MDKLINYYTDSCVVHFIDVVRNQKLESNLPIRETLLELSSAHRTWHEETRVFPKGTEIAVALAASYFTYWAASGLWLGTTGVVLQSGMAFLASQVSAQMVVHGDPVKALESIGDKKTQQGLIIAMASAGIFDKLSGVMNLNPTSLGRVPLYRDFLKAELVRSGVTTVLDIGIANRKLEDALIAGVKRAVVQSVARFGCSTIGFLYQAETIDPLIHKASHAVVAYIAEIAQGGNRTSGMGSGLGAMMAEVAGEALMPESEIEARSEAIKRDNPGISKEDFEREVVDAFSKERAMAHVIGTTAGALFFKEHGAKGADEASYRALEHNFVGFILRVGLKVFGKEALKKVAKTLGKKALTKTTQEIEKQTAKGVLKQSVKQEVKKLSPELRKKIPENLKGDEWLPPKEALEKIPEELGKGRLTDNGKGLRWFDKPTGTKESIRIMRGNPNSQWSSQQVDYVEIIRNGQVIRRDGRPILKSDTILKPSETPEAHIPLTEWLQWGK